MFGIGKLLSTATKVVTCPIDIVESVADVASGGDGSRDSKQASGGAVLSEMRDAACRALEDIDDD